MEPLPGAVVLWAPSLNPFPEKYRRPCLALYKTCARCIYCEGWQGPQSSYEARQESLRLT